MFFAFFSFNYFANVRLFSLLHLFFLLFRFFFEFILLVVLCVMAGDWWQAAGLCGVADRAGGGRGVRWGWVGCGFAVGSLFVRSSFVL